MVDKILNFHQNHHTPCKISIYVAYLDSMRVRGLCLYFGIVLVFGTSVGRAATVVFGNIPNSGHAGYDSSYDSHGFEAQNTAELGNVVGLAGTARKLHTVTITMVTHAKSADWSALYASNNVGWYHPLMLTVWKADASEILATKTVSTLIPWSQPAPGHQGMAFNVGFDFSSENITLPSSVLVSVAYNTQNDGFQPLGTAGPYNALNYGTFDFAPIVGSDVNPNEVMRVTTANPDEIVFETSLGWVDRAPMMEITATEVSESPYDVWIASYGYTVGVSPALRSEDADGDGMSNLTEFAFGTDPTFNSPNPITIARSNTVVTIQWLQRNDGSVTYTNRSTTNLTTGFPVGNSTNFVAALSTNTNNLPRAEYSRYQFSTNTSGFLRHFYKVDAQEVP